jgi:ATP-dependent helicase HrpA
LNIDQLQRLIAVCMLKDRPSLRRRLRRLAKLGSEVELQRQLARFEEAIAASQARLNERRSRCPRPVLPAELPITNRHREISQSIADHQVIIVCGETGSGKTTQLPKICLEAGRGIAGLIGHTQPRRIAARSVATRIAAELGSVLGEEVGYKVRFTDRLKRSAYIKLMTDGILLAEIQHDRLLLQYDTLIIDEAHERSLNIDFILGYLKRILPKRKDLKVVITSATIDPHRFAQYFNAAPVIEVSGRSYPVDIRYRPLCPDAENNERDLQQAILDAVDELTRLGRGDILVFLPGERQIRETAENLRKHHAKGVEILPLYARLSVAEQNRVFQAHQRQRIVLATNVAETSLTVPGIKYVIDTGTARINRYSVHSKVQRLLIEPVSQASAQQRTGRCGRTSPGNCIRLYAEEDFQSRPLFTTPEIQRTNLASVILLMSHLKLGAVDAFPFLDPPRRRLINDGYKLLEELGAVDEQRELTPIGRQLAGIPVDPRLARMLLAAVERHCLQEVLIIVSALAAQDPRERPVQHRESADQKQKRFQDERSDFLSLASLWNFLRRQQKHLSKRKFRKLCEEHFISCTRVYEWQDIHGQLSQLVNQTGLHTRHQDADYAAIHRALLSGLLSNIGCKDKEYEFLGARNRRFWIFPGSALHAKPPKWVMAAELTETSRLFARTVAKVEPQWVVEAASHLTRHEYFEPHWQVRAAQVGAFERITLYGLILIPRRRINYGAIAPSEARDIFIREALIAGRFKAGYRFIKHNHALIADILEAEAKTRRRDILVSEDTLYQFFNQRIPQHVHSGRTLEQWLKGSDGESQLYLSHTKLVRSETSMIDAQLYPEQLSIAGASLSLSYHFEPGEEHDGVTLQLPVAILNQIDPHICEWLVPGLLEEKVVALIKGLPKQLRRNFVPAPDFARACVEAMSPYQGSLARSLSQELLRMTGVRVSNNDWQLDAVADYLRMRFKIVDALGKTLRTGRNLKQLQQELAKQISNSFDDRLREHRQRSSMTDWDFDSRMKPVEVDHAGIRTIAYPAIVDRGGSVDIRLFDSANKAYKESRRGICRLYMLKLDDQVKYLQKNLPHGQSLCLWYQPFGGCEAIKMQIIEAVFKQVILDAGPLPENRELFLQRLGAVRSQLIPDANRLCDLLVTIFKRYYALRERLQDKDLVFHEEAIEDIEEQLGYLVYAGFILETPRCWLEQLPRYLKAIEIRLDRLQNTPDKDREARSEVAEYWNRYKAAYSQEQGDNAENEQRWIEYRWMVEEFRVSQFAQALKTSMPISGKRLDAQWMRLCGTESP